MITNQNIPHFKNNTACTRKDYAEYEDLQVLFGAHNLLNSFNTNLANLKENGKQKESLTVHSIA